MTGKVCSNPFPLQCPGKSYKKAGKCTSARTVLYDRKQQASGEQADDQTGSDITGVMDPAQDTDDAQDQRAEQTEHSRGEIHGQHAHGDDRTGKDVAAGHGLSLCVFPDQRLKIVFLVGAFPVQTVPDDTEQHKADARNQDIRKRTVDRAGSAAGPEAGQKQVHNHQRIQDVHGQCQCPVDKIQETGTVSGSPESGSEVLIKNGIIGCFHNVG